MAKMKVKGGVIEDDASIVGLFDCTMKYEIKNTKASIDWKGPKIPPEVWNEVLSFFQWCYDTYKSECQVRLFVSPTHQTWKAYAFPQEAKTGMTARELDNEEKNRQRAELNLNPPDWYYFGTVHHHCSTGAFQSGTDETNEQDQDGLHITIGNMDNKEKYDIHGRFYRKGLVIKNENLDMSWFWDVEAIRAQCPEAFRQYLPADWANKQARRLMTIPPAVISFPDRWKQNVIEIPTAVTISYGGTSHGTYKLPGAGSTNTPSIYSPDTDPIWMRCRAAWKEIVYKCVKHEIGADDIEQALGDLALADFAPNVIVMACRHHKVDPDDLERDGPQNLIAEIVEESLQQDKEAHDRKEADKKKESANPKSNTSEGSEGAKNGASGEAPAGGITDDPDWSQLHNI
jgi:hypothetical protein